MGFNLPGTGVLSWRTSGRLERLRQVVEPLFGPSENQSESSDEVQGAGVEMKSLEKGDEPSSSSSAQTLPKLPDRHPERPSSPCKPRSALPSLQSARPRRRSTMSRPRGH